MIRNSIEKFSQGFKTHKPSGNIEEASGMVVALTGSTGNLGACCFSMVPLIFSV
jgi:hypothetical protein